MADFRGLKMRARRARPTSCSPRWARRRWRCCRCRRSPTRCPKGVVDGYLLPWGGDPVDQGHELTKYHSDTDPKVRALYTRCSRWR